MTRKLLRYLGIILAGAAVVAAAYFILPKSAGPEEQKTSTIPSVSSSEKKTGETAPSSSSAKEKITLPPTSEKTSEKTIESSSGTKASEENTESTGSAFESTVTPSSEDSTESTRNSTETPPAPRVPDYSRVAFVGDSRTVFMGSGEERASGLVPNDALFATYGGTLTASTAFVDAWNAAASKRPLAVFWFGVNDVQVDPERDNTDVFLIHYEDVISVFREENAEAEIVILSVVGTSVHEKDHYDGQEENIDRYNEALREYCAEQGFRFLDLSFMNTSEADFFPDGIHFTKDWYERFVPALISALGL